MRRRTSSLGTAALLALAVGLAACGPEPASASATNAADAGLVSGPLPEFAEGGTWVNSPPLTLAGLKGKVVFLEFGFVGCQHCAAMIPTLERWQREHGPKGLQVLAVNDGRHGDRAALLAQVKNLKITSYAVLHDEEGATVERYGVQRYPAAFLVDRTGKVLWKGNPRRQEKAVEELLVAALAAR